MIVIQKYLNTPNYEVLLHLQYSSDLAPLDFHLPQSMANLLANKHFRRCKGVKDLDQYLCRFRRWSVFDNGLVKFQKDRRK